MGQSYAFDVSKIRHSRFYHINELQRQIGNYNKHRETFIEYLQLKKIPLTPKQKRKNITHPAEDFYEKNRASISLYRATKNYFDERGDLKDKKLSTIKMLQQEYAILEKEKRQLYSGYKQHREEMLDLKMMKQNVDMIFAPPKTKAKNLSDEHSL